MKNALLHNLLGKWLHIAPWQQHSALLFVSLLLCYLPLWNSYQSLEQWQRTQMELNEQQAKLAHQQQILASLTQRAEQTSLTPELANQLLPINQQIQRLSQGLQVQNSHWEFHQSPFLRLELESNFKNLQQFLTALLQQNSNIALLNLHISKATEKESQPPLQTELQFKLTLTRANTTSAPKQETP